MNVVKQHLLVGFDEDTQADEFLARDKVKVEHDKLHHLKELHLQHNTTSTREKVEIEHYKLHRLKELHLQHNKYKRESYYDEQTGTSFM